MHGSGTLLYPHGKSFTGLFQRDVNTLTGAGCVIYPSGVQFEGTVKDGEQIGRGQLTFPDGFHVEGNFTKNGITDGRRVGKYGTVLYTGDMNVNGKPHGQGVVLKKAYTYTGELNNSVFHHRGSLVYHKCPHPNKYNSTFNGVWKNGSVVSGEGVYLNAAEDWFIGTIVNQERTGYGELYEVNGSYKKGHFEKNVLTQGVIHTVVSKFKKYTYEGSFQGTKCALHGEGLYTHDDKAVYKASFLYGVMQSPVSITYPDGSTYEGPHVNKEKSGFGVYKTKNNTIYEGEFSEDFFHGQGKITYSNGFELSGEFREGRIYNGSGMLKGVGKSWMEGKY